MLGRSLSLPGTPRKPEENDAQVCYCCHAAAIYLQQGETNEKFLAHPGNPETLPTYLFFHNSWFYIVDFAVSLILLCLAIFESPTAAISGLPIWAHASIEIMCLFVICLQVAGKLHWLGIKDFFKQKRTILKILVLIVTITEAFVVLGRNVVHRRFTRCLRPIFILDSRFCDSVRRFVRQILQALPAVLDMVLVLILIMLVFSVIGHFQFWKIDAKYFGTPARSFVSLFVLLTSANFPDVMMPTYEAHRFNSLFFIAYVSMEMFFIMNLLLAVVYESFASGEKNKFLKLYKHRRESCQLAYRLLNSLNDQQGISITHFCILFHYLCPSATLESTYLTFKYLNTSGSNRLTLQEFFHIHEVLHCSWDMCRKTGALWYDGPNRYFRKLCLICSRMVCSRFFRYGLFLLSLLTGLIFFLHSFLHEQFVGRVFIEEFIVTDILIVIYSLELVVRFLGLGPNAYFWSTWIIFDTIVTILSIPSFFTRSKIFTYFIIFRTFDMFRLLKKWRPTYQAVFDTLHILLPRILNTSAVFVLLYYFYGIIGMELFWDYHMENCCNGSTVASSFVQTATEDGYYYLNNFKDIFHAGVTLFELTVVNNWFIIMEGYAWVSGEWSRLFFMSFYIVTMAVLTIVVAFILETFLFRIQCRRDIHGTDQSNDGAGSSQNLLPFELTGIGPNKVGFYTRASEQEMIILCKTNKTGMIQEKRMTEVLLQCHNELALGHVGVRGKTRFDFSAELYASEIQQWMLQQEKYAPRITTQPNERSSTFN